MGSAVPDKFFEDLTLLCLVLGAQIILALRIAAARALTQKNCAAQSNAKPSSSLKVFFLKKFRFFRPRL